MTTPRAFGPNVHAQVLGYVAAIFASSTAEQIADLLAELQPPTPFRVRFKVLYAEPLSVSRIVAQAAEAGRFQALSSAGLGYALRVPRAYVPDREDDLGADDFGGPPTPAAPVFPRSGSGLLYFAILPTAQPDVSVLVSVAPREDWLYLLREIRALYPKLVPIFLSQRELFQCIATLRDQVRGTYELRVRELSATEIIETAQGRRTRSLREWTEEAWERAIRDVADRRQVVTSVRLAFHRLVGTLPNVTASAVCKVTKRGEVEVLGHFALLRRTVIEDIAAAGQRKLSLYSKRGLREASYRAKPVSITYASDVFADVTEVRRLVEVLTLYPKSMHAVQHGNPYAYVQVADALDGSAFDVWALDQDTITIVPRLKATAAAFDRLIQYIFDAYREGVVSTHDDATVG